MNTLQEDLARAQIAMRLAEAEARRRTSRLAPHRSATSGRPTRRFGR